MMHDEHCAAVQEKIQMKVIQVVVVRLYSDVHVHRVIDGWMYQVVPFFSSLFHYCCMRKKEGI